MNSFNSPAYPSAYSVSEEQVSQALASAMRRVYLLMCAGLVVTALSAFATFSTPLGNIVLGSRWVFMGLLFAELGLVFGLSMAINRISPVTAMLMFFVYAIVNGITLSVVLLVYTSGSVAVAFFSSACMFGAMSVLGYTTKMDLTRWGSFLLMGLIGIIIASVVNMFVGSGPLDLIITIVGLLIFLGLTAYHTQRIKANIVVGLHNNNTDWVLRASVIGALSLYLDFINIFLKILRLIGRRR